MEALVDPALDWAYRSRPFPTETESGDAQVVAHFPGGASLAVIDGLGHGPEAAAASALAARTLRLHPGSDPVDLVTRCHEALRGTRGAAMLVVSLSFVDARVRWAGVGNIEGWHITAMSRAALISMAGVVGYQIATPRQRERTLSSGDVFVMASDGVAPSFMHDLRTDVAPDALAESILVGYARETDDALVLAARYVGDVS
jgi:negative regulator of sigma-B (phosphoserine phosphatase)